ncbi:MAG: cytidylate kinase family protein, partial [Magnetococcales bacterium]|nr:cytidylate kinase family protein [Magnetococcales bacterium]
MNGSHPHTTRFDGVASFVASGSFARAAGDAAPRTETHVPMVTISRSYGTNGTEVAQELARRLQVEFYDRELIAEVCRRTRADRFLMEKLYEQPVHGLDETIYNLVGMGGNSELIRVLPEVVADIRRKGGVLLGRGAHLCSSVPHLFRVRLDGSLPVCARRIMQRLQVSEAKARELIQSKNAEREAFNRSVYKWHRSRRQFYDMAINTDLFTTDQVVEMILCGMLVKNFTIPEKEVASLRSSLEPAERIPDLEEFDPNLEESCGEALFYQTGTVIFRMGEVADCLYLIQRGSVELMVESDSGELRGIAVLEAGDFFGEGALFTPDKKRMFTARAREETLAAPISERQLLAYLRAEPSLTLRLLRYSVGHITELTQEVRAKSETVSGCNAPRAAVHAQGYDPDRDSTAQELRLLVVEDDLDYFELLSAWVTDEVEAHGLALGHLQPHIVQASSLREAEMHLCQTRFSVVLLDLNLPDSEGLATFESRILAAGLDLLRIAPRH